MHEAPMYITHPEPQDIPKLEQIWMNTFGDPPELIEAFFDRFPPALNGWIVCREAEILSTAYLVHGNLLMHGDRMQPAAYVYAVATPQEHRGKGFGGMLMQHFAKLAEERELFLYTRPASAPLFHWYAENMQTVSSAPLVLERIGAQPSRDLPSVSRFSPGDYGSAREIMLANRPHILLSEAFLTLQETYLEAESGGYYGSSEGICACEVHGDTLVIKELLTKDCDTQFMQALLQLFSLPAAERFVRADNGSAHVAFRGSVPMETHWGLLLD